MDGAAALQAFADARQGGINHDSFRDEVLARYSPSSTLPSSQSTREAHSPCCPRQSFPPLHHQVCGGSDESNEDAATGPSHGGRSQCVRRTDSPLDLDDLVPLPATSSAAQRPVSSLLAEAVPP
jgi:hypothetical protein